MSGTNQFLPFAIGGSANTLTPEDYAALTAVIANGFLPGLASSQQANTVWRQATFVAAAVAQIIADQNVDANDDGNFSNFVANLTTAITNLSGLQASSVTTLTTNTVLSPTQVGGTVLGNATTTISATLPAASSAIAGKQIELKNINTGTFNILRAGTDTINVNTGTTTSQVLGQGDYLILESDGVSSWTALNGTVLLSVASAVISLLSTYAPLTSPTFTGSPAAPTPAAGDNTTRLATTAFVKNLFMGLGYGGTSWHAVSKSTGVVYTNTYSYPLMINLGLSASSASPNYTSVYVNGVLVCNSNFGGWTGTGTWPGTAVVPPGGTYNVEGRTPAYWAELY
jgi:hypothetical protein